MPISLVTRRYTNVFEQKFDYFIDESNYIPYKCFLLWFDEFMYYN